MATGSQGTCAHLTDKRVLCVGHTHEMLNLEFTGDIGHVTFTLASTRNVDISRDQVHTKQYCTWVWPHRPAEPGKRGFGFGVSTLCNDQPTAFRCTGAQQCLAMLCRAAATARRISAVHTWKQRLMRPQLFIFTIERTTDWHNHQGVWETAP